MPYRLFTPAPLIAGRTYPLIVFLHGAGGSGTDNEKQLQGANVFGALVWTLPDHQARHPAFVVAPQSNVNWPCTIFDPRHPPKRSPISSTARQRPSASARAWPSRSSIAFSPPSQSILRGSTSPVIRWAGQGRGTCWPSAPASSRQACPCAATRYRRRPPGSRTCQSGTSTGSSTTSNLSRPLAS